MSTDRKPWKYFESGNIKEVNTILYSATESLRILSTIIAPFMPNTGEQLVVQLGYKEVHLWEEITKWGKLSPEQAIDIDPEILFPRLEVFGK